MSLSSIKFEQFSEIRDYALAFSKQNTIYGNWSIKQYI